MLLLGNQPLWCAGGKSVHSTKMRCSHVLMLQLLSSEELGSMDTPGNERAQ